MRTTRNNSCLRSLTGRYSFCCCCMQAAGPDCSFAHCNVCVRPAASRRTPNSYCFCLTFQWGPPGAARRELASPLAAQHNTQAQVRGSLSSRCAAATLPLALCGNGCWADCGLPTRLKRTGGPLLFPLGFCESSAKINVHRSTQEASAATEPEAAAARRRRRRSDRSRSSSSSKSYRAEDALTMHAEIDREIDSYLFSTRAPVEKIFIPHSRARL